MIFFGTAFLARLLERLAHAVRLASQPLDFAANFGITEWLVNYAGGFQRRGLPGAIVHGLYSVFGIPPNASIIVACLGLYILFFAYLWQRSKGMVPRWVLLTTPLLGYPVFIDRVLIRKDILILVILAIAIRLISLNKGKLYDFAAVFALCVGMLSYELLAFLGVPAVSMLFVLRTYASWPPPFNNSVAALLKKSLKSLVLILVPVAAFIVVLVFRGTWQRSEQIALSWKDAYDPTLPFPGPTGSLAWLAVPSSDYIADSQRVLQALHFGVPLWAILIIASISGILFIAAAIGQHSRIRAWFFTWAAILQFVFMAILFYHSWDHGRWIVLCLLSAFLMSVETPLEWQIKFAEMTRLPVSLERFIMPIWFAPLGLALWGVEIVSWSPYGWISTAPIGILVQIYFYLRVLGVPKPW
jgi:hypothetical protein